MKIAVLSVGQTPTEIIERLSRELPKIFPDTTSQVIGEVLSLPEHALDKKRRQYNSTLILNELQRFATHHLNFNRILGVTNVDIFASGLSYVFGEAYLAGKSGLISLWRLRPQFYGEEPDTGALQLRTQKEAIHEIGHTLGLQHCNKNYCVMHFSNSIFDVDKKQKLFCDQCYLNASIAISNMG
jgi:archaemetzincin